MTARSVSPVQTGIRRLLALTAKLDFRFRGIGGVLATGLAAFLSLVAFPLHAQTFPPLTGRVVDAAGMFTPEERAHFDEKLKAVETSTGRRFVIATIPDLQGYPLEDYGYRLGRAWGIGQKGANNGVVVFVAPNNPPGQRGPRIEVGYGLEPILTDAFTGVVANSVMTPLLRAGDKAGAFDKGIDAIAEQIKLTPEEAAKHTAALSAQQQTEHGSVNGGAFVFWIVIFFFVILPMIGRLSGGRRYQGGGGIGNIILWSALNGLASSGRGGGSDWGGGGGFGGGGGGGGYSGGGGSFGGGGASGGW